MKSLKIVSRAIKNHPLASKEPLKAWRRFLQWQIISRIYKNGIVVPYVENSLLLVKPSMHGATGAIYLGLQEFEDMMFMLHLLVKKDSFYDIGANIGSYSILAAKVIGTKVVAIEPIPQTFGCLQNNIAINNISDKIQALNIGVGEEEGILKFTNAFDTVNHVVLGNKNDESVIEVQVESLNALCKNKKLSQPILMKIDVEGFELSVLNGASDILMNEELKAIIIEINGCCKSFGVQEMDIHNKLVSYNFKAYTYNPFTRSLESQSSFTPNGNTIYIRDLPFVKQRLLESRDFKILGKRI